MTGFVYDTVMSYHATPDPIEIHPEDPRRIYKIFSILEKHGLLAECIRIKSRRATREEITAIHSIIHYRKMRETTSKLYI
jgi:histone deacetylase 6